jgi:hypothetical protein
MNTQVWCSCLQWTGIFEPGLYELVDSPLLSSGPDSS